MLLMRIVPLAPKSILMLPYQNDLVNFAPIVKFHTQYLKVVMDFAHIAWEDHMLETVQHDCASSETNTEW